MCLHETGTLVVAPESFVVVLLKWMTSCKHVVSSPQVILNLNSLVETFNLNALLIHLTNDDDTNYDYEDNKNDDDDDDDDDDNDDDQSCHVM